MTGWQESYRKKGWVGAYPYWVPFLLFVLVLSPTPGMPRLERHGAPFCQDFGSDWWSSHVIKDGSPGIQGFWWGLQQGWTQTGEAVNILEGPRAQVSSRHKQMQASLCLASCAGVLSAFLLSPFFFFFSVSISLQRLIYPSICIPGIQARDTGYNCILVSCHSVTDKKVRFLLCVVWVSLLIHTSELGQLWAAITLPDVRFTRWLTQVPENDPPQFLHPGPALCFWQHGTHQMRGKRRVATLTLTIHI